MKTLKQYIKESLLDDEEELGSNIINKIKSSIENFLKENYKFLKNYKISNEPNEDGKYVVDCNGDLIVTNHRISALTNEYFVFGKVKRHFNCSGCDSLTSLKGAPEEVGGDFTCLYCTSLTSLQGASKMIDRNFNCSYCKSLTSLQGAPEELNGNFNCSYCKSLTSLQGAPKEVGGEFYCFGCKKQFTKEDVLKISKVKGEIIAKI